MRTTLDLDGDLLERAKESLDAGTYRETITRAVEDAVARVDLRRLVERIEGSDLTWELDDLLAYRRTEAGHRGPST